MGLSFKMQKILLCLSFSAQITEALAENSESLGNTQPIIDWRCDRLHNAA